MNLEVSNWNGATRRTEEQIPRNVRRRGEKNVHRRKEIWDHSTSNMPSQQWRARLWHNQSVGLRSAGVTSHRSVVPFHQYCIGCPCFTANWSVGQTQRDWLFSATHSVEGNVCSLILTDFIPSQLFIWWWRELGCRSQKNVWPPNNDFASFYFFFFLKRTQDWLELLEVL